MLDVIIGKNRIKNIDLLVFDKDGTLIDLYNYWSNMISLRAEKICDEYSLNRDKNKQALMFEMGVDLENRRLRPEGPVGLLPRAIVQKVAESYLSQLGFVNTSDNCFKIFEEVDQTSLSLLDKFIKPIDGAIELLRDIKTKGGTTAIATTDRTKRAELAIDFLNISNLIDLTIGADKVEKSKPAPDMLNLICRKLDIVSEKAVMIGDANTDIEMGINAGFKASIAVCSGLTPRKSLSKLTSYLVKDVSNIHIE